MYISTIRQFILTGLCTFAVSAAAFAEDLTQVFYPDEESVEFIVMVPSAWEMTAQEGDGPEDYFEVEGPNDLELSFRTVPGADIEKAVEAHIKYLKENFTDIKMEETVETKVNGLEAILLPGSGKDEDGVQREFGAGWFQISEEKIGELWYNVAADDAKGAAAALAVLNSLSGKPAAAE